MNESVLFPKMMLCSHSEFELAFTRKEEVNIDNWGSVCGAAQHELLVVRRKQAIHTQLSLVDLVVNINLFPEFLPFYYT